MDITSSRRRRSLQKAKPICARRVAARPGEARNKAKLDRIVPSPEYNWDRRRRGFGRKSGGGEAGRGDHRHTTTLAAQKARSEAW